MLRGQGAVDRKRKKMDLETVEILTSAQRAKEGGRLNRVTEENTAALMMGDMQPLLPSSPSTDDMAQTPMCQ